MSQGTDHIKDWATTFTPKNTKWVNGVMAIAKAEYCFLTGLVFTEYFSALQCHFINTNLSLIHLTYL